MNTIQAKLPLIAFIFLILHFLPSYIKYVVLFIYVCYWIYQERDYSFCLLIILFIFIEIPFYSKDKPTNTEGTVSQIATKYYVIQNGRTKWIVYTNEEIPYDTKVKVEGDFQYIQSNYGFYRFDFANHCHQKGTYYSQQASKITIAKPTHSIRGHLYEKVIKTENEELKKAYKRILFGIRDEETSLQSFLQNRGFSYLGLLRLFDNYLKKIQEKKKRLTILRIIHIILCIIFRFPYLLVQSLLLTFLKQYMPKIHAFSLFVLFTIRFYPTQLYGILFWFLLLMNLNSKKMKMIPYRLFYLSILQSFFYHEMNPILSLVFPYLLLISSLFIPLSFVSIWLNHPLFILLLTFIDRIFSFFNYFTWHGSVIGFGIVLFIPLLLMIYQSKYRIYYACILLFLFQYFGFFHPLAEVTYINVGQGDSILIRMPFNQENILIDTGKPSAYQSLNTILKAKGIKDIHTLIITHQDDDHSGNQDRIQLDFHVKELISKHHPTLNTKMKLMSLNTIDNEDENQSSIVNYLELNGLRYLFMADADETTEKELIDKYPLLQCDVLKASHHGSKTGSSERFLNTVQPKLGIFSCGSASIYHHPHEEVIQRFLQRHIPYLITREEGDISIFAFYHRNLFVTSRGKISLL